MSIISIIKSDSCATLDEIVVNEAKMLSRVTIEQATGWGLCNKKILLSENHNYKLYRQGKVATIVATRTGKQVAFSIEERKPTGKDKYARSRIRVNKIEKKCPELYEYLIPTGIWTSLNSDDPKVYLNRLSYALKHATSIRWEGENTAYFEDTSPSLLAVDHIDGNCCNDHWTNLRLLTYAAHAKVENERTKKEWEEAYESLWGSVDESDYLDEFYDIYPDPNGAWMYDEVEWYRWDAA